MWMPTLAAVLLLHAAAPAAELPTLTAAAKALRRIAPQGGNTLLDALVEASRDLKEQEGRRSAVVVVTGLGTEFSNYDRRQVVELAKKSSATFLAVVCEEGPVTFEDR